MNKYLMFSQILQNLGKTKDVKILNSWRFPDNFVDHCDLGEIILGLKQNNDIVGLLKFRVNDDLGYDYISIEYIQGVKGKDLPKDWYDILLKEVISASLPFILEKREGKYVVNPLKFRLRGLEYALEDKNFLMRLRAHIKEKVDNKIIEELETKLDIINDVIKFYKKIRDRWFKKEGYLSPNKKRVLETVKEYLMKKNKLKVEFRKKIEKRIPRFKINLIKRK